MSKAVALILCVLAVATVAHGHGHPHTDAHNQVLYVEGEVYCDPCRVQFKTELSHQLSGATVRLDCYQFNTSHVVYSVKGKTNAAGHYRLRVVGEHETEICNVRVVKSPRPDCGQIMNGVVQARVVCSKNIGMSSGVRYANPLGFMTEARDDRCISIMKDLIDDEE